MAPGPRTPVAAPPARPPRFGLIAAAPEIQDGTRWENGYVFNPEGCVDGGVFDGSCSPQDLDFSGCRDNIETDPFVVWAGIKRSTAGMDLDEYRARARRQLEATQSFHLAREFWTGELAQLGGLEGQRLTGDPAGTDVVTLSVGPTEALACLEQYLGDCAAGQQGMIHATRQVVTYWVEKYLVTRQGGQLVTAFDTIVVPDAGYTGSAPDRSNPVDGSVWAYATGIVTVRLGSVQTSPPEGDMNALFNISSNDVAMMAWRLAAVSHDGCCLGAAEIDLDVCRIGGAS